MTVRALDNPAHERSIAIALAAGLFTLYLGTFSGLFRSVDELALFALTESLVQQGRFSTELVRFAAYHNPVGALEPGYPVLAAPLYGLARAVPWVSNIHGVMLLNPILIAGAAGVLFVLGRRLNYPGGASLGLAVAFGLGSMAWPFTRSFLREPAVGLLWLLMFWAWHVFDQRPSARALAALGACLGLAIAMKFSSVVAVPVMAGLVGWRLARGQRLRPVQWLALLALAAAATTALAMGLFAARGLSGAGLLEDLVREPFAAESWLAWYGLLASPAKSIFVFSPVLLLSLVGARDFGRAHPRLAAGILSLTALLLIALRTAQWWGGVTWGPRFMLPLLPLLLLPAASALARYRWAWLVLGMSVVFQALVATSNWSAIYGELLTRYPNYDLTVGLDWTRWAESPVAVLLQRWGRSNWEIFWLYTGLGQEVKLDVWAGLGLGVGVAATGAALAIVLAARGAPRTRLALGSLGLAILCAVFALWRAWVNFQDYPGQQNGQAQALSAAIAASPARRVINLAADFSVYPWLGILKGPVRAAWLSPFDPGPFTALAPAGAPFLVVVDHSHLWGHRPEAFMRWLTLEAYRYAAGWQAGYEVLAAAGGPNPAPERASAAVWETGAALEALAVAEAAPAGAVLKIDLVFRCQAERCPSAAPLFTNLLGPEGVLIPGSDAAVQQGLLPEWRAGEIARDRRGIWIPADAPPGEYVLLIGFTQEGRYVPVQTPGGASADYAEPFTLTVTPP